MKEERGGGRSVMCLVRTKLKIKNFPMLDL